MPQLFASSISLQSLNLEEISLEEQLLLRQFLALRSEHLRTRLFAIFTFEQSLKIPGRKHPKIIVDACGLFIPRPTKSSWLFRTSEIHHDLTCTHYQIADRLERVYLTPVCGILPIDLSRAKSFPLEIHLTDSFLYDK